MALSVKESTNVALFKLGPGWAQSNCIPIRAAPEMGPGPIKYSPLNSTNFWSQSDRVSIRESHSLVPRSDSFQKVTVTYDWTAGPKHCVVWLDRVTVIYTPWVWRHAVITVTIYEYSDWLPTQIGHTLRVRCGFLCGGPAFLCRFWWLRPCISHKKMASTGMPELVLLILWFNVNYP